MLLKKQIAKDSESKPPGHASFLLIKQRFVDKSFAQC